MRGRERRARAAGPQQPVALGARELALEGASRAAHAYAHGPLVDGPLVRVGGGAVASAVALGIRIDCGYRAPAVPVDEHLALRLLVAGDPLLPRRVEKER